MKKIVLVFFAFTFLTGCIEGSVMLGSAISVASTGGIQQALISQGINHGIKKKTGKSISEHAHSSLNEEVMTPLFTIIEYLWDLSKKPTAGTVKLNPIDFVYDPSTSDNIPM